MTPISPKDREAAVKGLPNVMENPVYRKPLDEGFDLIDEQVEDPDKRSEAYASAARFAEHNRRIAQPHPDVAGFGAVHNGSDIGSPEKIAEAGVSGYTGEGRDTNAQRRAFLRNGVFPDEVASRTEEPISEEDAARQVGEIHHQSFVDKAWERHNESQEKAAEPPEKRGRIARLFGGR